MTGQASGEHYKDGSSAAQLLRGTPYLIAGDSFSESKFHRVMEKANEARARAARVGTLIRNQLSDVFESFGLVLRSELVAESNRIERIDWTPAEVREVVHKHRDLLTLPAHTFVESVRGDGRTYEVIGLYRAQLLAEEWAQGNLRPREIEIRQLHAMIVGQTHYAGRYKVADNSIGGAVHVPPAPAEAAESMRDLAAWWQVGTGSPVLDATVVHAWLAHLHAFEDGNGRLARLLANMALSQHGYPPLIIQADSDRGEYYDALAASDDGDVLPLLDLFTRLLRRAVRRMGQPDYIEHVIRDRMLTTLSQQQQLWQALVERFSAALSDALGGHGLEGEVQGYPSHAAFKDLADLEADGNSWYMKVLDGRKRALWLLWFGFNSYDYCDVFDGPSGYPSIFLSIRSDDPSSIHPYRPLAATADESIWTQLILVPGRAKPARLLVGYRWLELSIEDAAAEAASLITTSNVRR